MSHAALVVALTPEEVEKHKGIKEALDYQMAPFNENEEMFRDGSRWDWYQIGGRYTGLLSAYDPYEDPANQEICDLCNGTGKRTDSVADANPKLKEKCNGCAGEGHRLKFSLNEFQGDVVQVKDLDLKAIRESEMKRWKQNYKKSLKEDTNFKEMIYGVKEGETLEQFLARKNEQSSVHAYGFLQNRHWHEGERLGWFGSSTATECELKNPASPLKEGKCLYKDKATGARIVCWNEPWEVWSKVYYQRFIQPLNPETYLVVVDYHV